MQRYSGIMFSLIKTLFKFINSRRNVYSKIGYYFPNNLIKPKWNIF